MAVPLAIYSFSNGTTLSSKIEKRAKASHLEKVSKLEFSFRKGKKKSDVIWKKNHEKSLKWKEHQQ